MQGLAPTIRIGVRARLLPGINTRRIEEAGFNLRGLKRCYVHEFNVSHQYGGSGNGGLHCIYVVITLTLADHIDQCIF
jgi:hypothetical protein